MDIDIRKSIKKNFLNCNINDIKDSIESSINDNEEITLPGLGVFFEIVWKNSNKEYKDYILNTIIKGL